jgi:hypothetical protein
MANLLYTRVLLKISGEALLYAVGRYGNIDDLNLAAAGLEADAARGKPLKSPQRWKRAFDEPIPLPRGRHLVTLKDAAEYIQKLPKAERQIAEWQAAVEALLLVVELSAVIAVPERVGHGCAGPSRMARRRLLRRHVTRCTQRFGHGTGHRTFSLDESCQAKIREVRFTIGIYQDVPRLNISM